jgi:hypothetical protein
MNLLTIIFPYYNQAKALDFQLQNYSSFTEETRKKLKIFIVDDGSQINKAIDCITDEFLKKLDITLYRIDIDIPWNQPETNNLAFSKIETEFLLRYDIDCYFDEENIKKLMLVNDINYAFNMNRKKYSTNELIKPHPNLYLLPKNIYKTFKYNEYFSGNYGLDDIDLNERLNKDNKINFLNNIFCWTNNEKFSTHKLIRDSSVNTKKLTEKNRPFYSFLHKQYYKLQILNSKKI